MTVLDLCRCVEQLLDLSEHDTVSDSELASLLRCALVGDSRTSLVAALLDGLHTGQAQASPKTSLKTALRSVPSVWLLTAGMELLPA